MTWNITESVKSGGAHTTLADFRNAHASETPADGPLTAEVTGVPADTGTVYWDGFQPTMTEDFRIIVKAATGKETDGTDAVSDEAVIEDTQNMFENAEELFIDFIGLEFNGVQIFNQQSGKAGQLRIAKCFFHDMGLSGVDISNSMTVNVTVKIGGCLFDSVGTAGNYNGGVEINDTNGINVEVFNCTATRCGNGYAEFAGDMTVKNSVSILAVVSDFSGINVQDYNASGDTTSAGANSTDSIDETDSSANVEFTDPSADDYTIEDVDSLLYETGEIRSEQWFIDLCPTDLNGVTWRATPARGCYEFEVVVAGNKVGALINAGLVNSGLIGGRLT